MTRDKPITIYVSPEEKKHLQAEADANDESLSSYLYKLVQQQREKDGLDRSTTELNAEERIEAMIAEATDQLEDVANDIRDVNARAGAYSIANFELLKQNYPDARRQEVLQTGARRLRYPLDEHDDLSSSTTDSDTQTQGESGENHDPNTDTAASDSETDLTERLRGDPDE